MFTPDCHAPPAETAHRPEARDESPNVPAVSPIEDIIDDARNGRIFIMVDDEDRENEGDLIIPAQMATPTAINFMAQHGRGLICLALTQERVAQLHLPMMARDNRSRHETAFTVSIEARRGVTTGISAADRARTIAVAADAANGPEEIVTPGHVFPLVARDGGVLVRAGHTEAAVDVARLAGLSPGGVICEIMNDDGTMARLGDLSGFARRHGLRIGTIRDLIAYRRRFDRNLDTIGEMPFVSHFGGDWRAVTFRDRFSGHENVALIKGEIGGDKATLVRMHRFNLLADALGEQAGRFGFLQASMAMIANEGAGVVVIINDGASGTPSGTHGEGADGFEDMEGFRSYGVGAQILAELKVHDMVLITNSHHSPVALGGYGLNIVGERRISQAS